MSTQAIRDALAAGPTGGVWQKGTTGGAVVSDQHVEHGPNGCDCVNYYGGHLIAESVAGRNLDFIAACNPAAIAALLKELDAKTEALEKIAKADNGESGCYYTNRANIKIARAALTPSIGEQG